MPFEDECFDLVTTYQTLEHVRDVNMCVLEMLRVLRPGGILYIRAPDYNCFYEPHYRVPFLPRMNKTLATIYLKFLGRPVSGLQTLHWVTKKEIIRYLKQLKSHVNIEDTHLYYFAIRRKKILELLPIPLKREFIVHLLNRSAEIRNKINELAIILSARQERNIDLWVVKN